MAAKIVLIADAVVAHLAGQDFLGGYVIDRAYEAPATPGQIENGRVTVAPVTRHLTITDRAGRYFTDYGVDVAIHKSLTGPNATAGIDLMIDVVEQTADALKGGVFEGCNVVAIDQEDLQSLIMLSGAAVFQSVMRLMLKELR